MTRSRKAVPLGAGSTTPELHESLRGAALRVTRPHLAVLSAVHDHPHASTETIIRVVRDELAGVSHPRTRERSSS